MSWLNSLYVGLFCDAQKRFSRSLLWQNVGCGVLTYIVMLKGKELSYDEMLAYGVIVCGINLIKRGMQMREERLKLTAEKQTKYAD
jgi:hypothetical protein